MKLVIVRHLPTAWNAEDRLQGQRDVPIVPPDAATLAAIARTRDEVLALGPFDRVYCSRMGRTRQTAELFGYTEVIADPLLDEISFGEYEGRLRKEMLAAVGTAWDDAPHTLTFGESMAAFGERVQQFLRNNAAHARVLVFGHGGWTRALWSLRETGSLERMNKLAVGNGQTLVFEV
jgi:probable phosphoglycerate mutase